MKQIYPIPISELKSPADFFNENGYIFLKDYLNVNAINEFENEFVKLCKPLGIKKNTFDEICIHLNKTDKDLLYKIHSVASKLTYLSKIGKDAQRLIRLIGDTNPLINIGETFLLGLPDDKRLVYDYHQESNFMQGFSNIYNVHYPFIRKADENNGSMSIIPKTHKLGTLEFIKSKLSNNSYTNLIPVSIDKIREDYEEFQCVLELGDIIIFHKDLIHKSNHNESQLCRPVGIHRFTSCIKGSMNYNAQQ